MDGDDDDFLTMGNDDFYRLDGDNEDILSHWEEMIPPSMCRSRREGEGGRQGIFVQ